MTQKKGFKLSRHNSQSKITKTPEDQLVLDDSMDDFIMTSALKAMK